MPDCLPLQLLLVTFAGWGNRQQAQLIDYLVEEDRILKEQIGGRRLRLTDEQRRRLAAKGKVLGRKLLERLATIVTHYTLFGIDIATRAVHIAGTTPNPDGAFMAQVARNLTDCVDGFLRGKRSLIIDLDTRFTEKFRDVVRDAGIDVVRTSFQAPDMNAFAERWVRSIKHECLSKMIFFGPAMLERSIREYVIHYNRERPHQSLDNELIDGEAAAATGEVVECERLGGVLRYYHHAAT